MGSWYAVKNGVGYTFAAVAENVQADEREKFKCSQHRNPSINTFFEVVCS
jgi:hypothetical protein